MIFDFLKSGFDRFIENLLFYYRFAKDWVFIIIDLLCNIYANIACNYRGA